MTRNTVMAKATQAALTAMEGAGHSQASIAKAVGTTPASVSRWRHGNATPRAQYAAKLSHLAVQNGFEPLPESQPLEVPEDRLTALEGRMERIEDMLTQLTQEN